MTIEEIINGAQGKALEAYIYSLENNWINHVEVPDQASFHVLLDQDVVAVEVIDHGDVVSTYIRTAIDSWEELELNPDYTKSQTVFAIHLHTLALNLMIKEFNNWTAVRMLLLDDLRRQEDDVQFKMVELKFGREYFILPLWAKLYKLSSMNDSIRTALIEWFFQNYPVFL